MAFMNWTDDLSVGVDLFDQQHQKLIDIINRLHSGLMDGKGKEVISGMLQELLDYTDTHFSEEEAQLARVHYPGLEDQQKQHAHFISKINEIGQKQETGELFVAIETMQFLNNWLVKHIKGEDKRYEPYLKGKV